MTAVCPPVSIVLATLNGARFLRAQLQSICDQSHENWRVILSDDGSSDASLAIARDCLARDRLHLLRGPQQGIALNFWRGLSHVPKGHFAAFCDQDDVWCKDKLERALAHLGKDEGPALYSAGRFVTDAGLNVTHRQLRAPVKGFARTFLRNPVAGHTCVLSPAAVDLLKRAPPTRDVPFHDWWAALILSRAGARFVHDTAPVLYYRQHERNVLGAAGGRAKAVLNGTYFRWLCANASALHVASPRALD
ncbi:glycosyltransferase [Planktotalea arctica]|uniref:glycosyltransferase n=1 Tax=Planktotalea arctica TaxID=1481893 RepID=UPI003219FC3A